MAGEGADLVGGRVVNHGVFHKQSIAFWLLVSSGCAFGSKVVALRPLSK